MVNRLTIAAHSIGLEWIENPPKVVFGVEGPAGARQRSPACLTGSPALGWRVDTNKNGYFCDICVNAWPSIK